MILFKGPCSQLLNPLQAVAGVVEKRHTMAILANVLFEKKGDRITLLATDNDIQITTHAPSDGGEDFAITVAAKKLHDVLRSLPEMTEIKLTLNDARLQVKSKHSSFNLQTLPAADFPTMSVTIGQGTQLTLPQRQVKHMLSQVQYAMAQQDLRYYLNGLLMVAKGNSLRMVATDGHRLAYVGGALPAELPTPIEAIIPRKTVLELSRQLGDSDDPLTITLSKTQARFEFGAVELISKLIEGKYPDYERVIPKNLDKVITLSRDGLAHALQRAAIMTAEKFRSVRFVIDAGLLKIYSSNTEHEEAQEEIEIDYRDMAIDVGFNIVYLQEVLNNLTSKDIELHFADSNSSALILIPGSSDFKYVVMPMRI